MPDDWVAAKKKKVRYINCWYIHLIDDLKLERKKEEIFVRRPFSLIQQHFLYIKSGIHEDV